MGSRWSDPHERWVLATLLVGVSAACWAWIAVMADDMYGTMSGAAAWMMTSDWDAPHLLLLGAMWAVMMTAMMLPSAAPLLILLFAVTLHWLPAGGWDGTWRSALVLSPLLNGTMRIENRPTCSHSRRVRGKRSPRTVATIMSTVPAMRNRAAVKRSGGISPTPILLARNVEPQTR